MICMPERESANMKGECFDAENNNATPSNSPEVPVQSTLSMEETRNTPGTAHECSPETSSQRKQVCDVTDTYTYMEPT